MDDGQDQKIDREMREKARIKDKRLTIDDGRSSGYCVNSFDFWFMHLLRNNAETRLKIKKKKLPRNVTEWPRKLNQ